MCRAFLSTLPSEPSVSSTPVFRLGREPDPSPNSAPEGQPDIAGNRVNDSTSGLSDFRFFGASGNSPSNNRNSRPGASGDVRSNAAR
jgi:hypothetical protein